MKNKTAGVPELTLAPETKKVEDAIAPFDLANGAASMPDPVEKARPQKARRLAEIPALRGKNHKVFRMSDGTEQAVFSPFPVHSLDAEAHDFKEAEDTLAEDKDGKHLTCARPNFIAKFNRDEDDELFQIEQGRHKVTVYTNPDKSRARKKPSPKRSKGTGTGTAEILTFCGIAPNTDYEYSVKGNGIKENIVVRQPSTAYRYPFVIACENVTVHVNATSKRIAFLSTESGEEVFYIPAPFMKDAKGVVSTAVDYEVAETKDGATLLTVIADTEWMNASGRVFPVAIDPQISVPGDAEMTTYSWLNGEMIEGDTHKIGFSENTECACCDLNRMYMSFTMPKLPRNPRIKKAELQITQENSCLCGGNGRPLIGLYQVQDSIAIGTCTPAESYDLIDYARMTAEECCCENSVSYTFDITTLLDMLKWGESNAPRLVLRLLDETGTACNEYITVHGSENSSYSPKIVITYEATYAVNTSYRTHTHQLGRYGHGAVDLQRGNLMFELEDFAWSGNRMPVTIKHLFNSVLSGYMYANNQSIQLHTAYSASMQIGYGFKLNVMQSMMKLNSLPLDWATVAPNSSVADRAGYVYIDDSGAETYFRKSATRTARDEEGNRYYLYEDINDTEVLYDPELHTLTRGDDTYIFDIFGRLVEIRDVSNNRMTITYDSANHITLVTDGAGREFVFDYDGKLLISITAPNGEIIRYNYTNYLLTGITYPDESKLSITYSWNKPVSVKVQDSHDNTLYQVDYAFSDGPRLMSVTEYSANGTLGARSTYDYSVAAARTVVTTTEPKDTAEGETADTVITTTYTFDDDGNVVSEYVYSPATGNVGGDGKGSGINPHSGEGGAGVVSNINNLLLGHRFEGEQGWKKISSGHFDTDCDTPDCEGSDCCESDCSGADCCESTCNCFTVQPVSDETEAKFGKTALLMQCGQPAFEGYGVYWDTMFLAAGKYTFSAYLRVNSAFSSNTAPGAFLRVLDASGNTLGISENLVEADDQYTRLILPFELTDTQCVQVQVVANGAGSVYIDAPQLENNPYANAYNMLENGNFECDGNTWHRGAGVSYSTDCCFNMSRALRMDGVLDGTRSVFQYIPVKSAFDTKETFTLSGWAKGYGLSDHERTGVLSAPLFRLRAYLAYTDGSSENFVADFSPCTEEWQLASVQFAKSHRKRVSGIYVFCEYSYNWGTAYFDDIQLVRNSIETGLLSDDFEGATTTYSEEEGTSATEKETYSSFEEAKDEFGNTLTETTFTDGEFGTLYRAFGFSEDGNDLLEEIDTRGFKTSYKIDSETSRNEEVTDRLGNKTVYKYDALGRTTGVTSKNAADETLANVSYAYDAFDNMTAIIRGDEMEYALAYNEFHNLESIGINGKTEKLIKYTYKNGNGRLKQMTYANGHTMKATYNAIGQMVAERWFETEAQAADSTATPMAHYKYVYDGEGNIVRSIDIIAKKEYNYEYEEGKIVRATEADITVSGEVVIAKVVTNTIKYYYDSEGKMNRKVTVFADGSTSTVQYESADDNTFVRFDVPAPTESNPNQTQVITSHSGTDSFGRKVFDELQLGAGFVSRQFFYMPGAITETHTNNKKIKSTATTQLVSQIALSDGRTISYDYDDEERIIKVTDTIDGTVSYTYDALGQLETETRDGVTTKFEYDNYGNITAKGEVDETGEIAEATKISYVYSNGAWKDLLTSYNGQTITYDVQGNPTSYLGHTLTWEKGRQLKKLDNIEYTYNANGIRTSKKVNGVLHTYTLDGTKILREVWGDNTLIPLYDNEDGVCGILYNNVPYYFLKNLQGDVIAIVDKDAQTVARYSYDAWGVCTVTQDSVSIATINPFRYRGYYYDEENDLYYLQSRYYDAVVGRFISSDDALFANQKVLSCHNIYIYCYNDAINKVDHTGFAVISLSIASIAAIAKVAVSFFLLAGVIYAITKIVTDRSFQRVLSSANSKIRSGDRSKFRGAIIAILAAYAVAKIQSKKNKYEVHHIVAQTAKKAAPARDVLKHKSVKIGLHSSTNTVSIRYNLHKRLHTDSYYDAINALMIKSFNNGTSGAKERVTAALTSVKTVLSHLSSTTP